MNAITHPAPRNMTPDIEFYLPFMQSTFDKMVIKMSQNKASLVPWPDFATMYNLDTSQIPMKYQTSIPPRFERNVLPPITKPLLPFQRAIVIENIIIAHRVLVRHLGPEDPEVTVEDLYARLFEHDHISYALLIQRLSEQKK
jgi:hypothetical protein